MNRLRPNHEDACHAISNTAAEITQAYAMSWYEMLVAAKKFDDVDYACGRK